MTGSQRAGLPGRGSRVLPSEGPSDTARQGHSGPGEGPGTSVATFHVQLGGLYDFLVHHEVGQLSEEDGARVDEHGVIKERGLQRGGARA